MSQKIAAASVEYMQNLYDKTGEYKVSSGMIWEELVKKFPTLNKQTLYNALNTLKRNKTVVNLDEPVPNQKGAFYFALASVLDKVTEPKLEVKPQTIAPVAKEEVKPVSTVAKTTPKLPSQVATNPLDKISSQLGEMLSKIDGLSKGYTEVVESQNLQRMAMEAIAKHEVPDNTSILEKLNEVLGIVKDSEVSLDIDDITQIRNAVTEILTSPESQYIETIRALVSRENKRQTGTIFEHTASKMDGLISAMERIGFKVPENVNSSDDYKMGIREGIRLAIEMGLKL